MASTTYLSKRQNPDKVTHCKPDVCLEDARVFLPQQLSKISSQGDSEFKNEVMIVAKLKHRNLVRLLGFSLERKERLLIYEFVPNKSLNYFIFGKWDKHSTSKHDKPMLISLLEARDNHFFISC
ncbi:hypothetical protein L6164_012416 [Bauhinia variegata]|uniref:Uncharacterized protein n=1 Tax=Bauhinia variegata TaxID=167791 RepID=A0ACB9PBI5_BAUVA|nr:hypothetical protein L6164_012416 [Bauhinia variegata]